VALSQARILYQNHSGDYPQVILTIPVTCRTSSQKYGFGIRDPGSGKNLFRIPDPGVKKAPDPGSATLLNSLFP
jgi:hypothetical protein